MILLNPLKIEIFHKSWKKNPQNNLISISINFAFPHIWQKIEWKIAPQILKLFWIQNLFFFHEWFLGRTHNWILYSNYFFGILKVTDFLNHFLCFNDFLVNYLRRELWILYLLHNFSFLGGARVRIKSFSSSHFCRKFFFSFLKTLDFSNSAD